MGRKIRTDIPELQQNLMSKWPYIDYYIQDFTVKHEKFIADQKRNYDRRHRVRPLPEDQPVWVSTEGRQMPGTVANQANTPRSYLVATPSGQVRRNRSHLHCRSESSDITSSTQSVQMPNQVNIRLCTGTAIRPPDRLDL